MRITADSDGIKVEGYRGKWYVIDSVAFVKDGEMHEAFLLEHETYGDETEGLIVDEDGKLLEDDVWNGFDDFEERGWNIVG